MGKTAVLFLLSLCLLAAQALGEDDSSARHQAGLDISAHRLPQALAELHPLLAAHPDDASLWTLRAVALDGLGRTTDSLAAFDRALRIDPGYLPALEGAAQTAYRHRDPRAPLYLRQLLHIAPQSQMANAMAGVLAWESHICNSAMQYFSHAPAAVAQQPTAASEYADCLLKDGQPPAAGEILSRSLQLHPHSVQLSYNLAVVDLQNHNPTAAAALLEPFSTLPDSGLLNLLASAYVALNQPDQAFRTLETAIRISPDRESNYLDLAILCLEHNQERQSIQAATAGIAALPRAASLYLIRGVAYAQLAQDAQAEEDFSTAAKLQPNQPHSTIAMSLLYSDRQQIDREKQLLIGQLKKTPNDAVTNYLLADLLIRLGAEPGQPAFQQAKEHAALSVRSRPDSAEAQVLLGRILQEENDPTAALRHFQAALRVEPDNQAALNRELLVLRQLHRYDQAQTVIAHLKEVLSSQFHPASASTQVRTDANTR